MNRFNLAYGIFLLAIGMSCTIATGVADPKSFGGPLAGAICMLIGSFLIAYSLPKKP